MANVMIGVTVVYYVASSLCAINSLTDWLGGIHYHGIFSGAVVGAMRLVYQRGLFDGFVAGVVVLLIARRERK